MNHVKTLMVLVLLVILIFCFSTTVLAADANIDAAAAYEWLLEAGFPEKTLAGRSDDNLIRMYHDNASATDLTISTSTVHMNEGTLSGIQPYDDIPSSHLDFTLTTSTSSRYGEITRVIAYVNWEWLNGRPYVRLTDGIIVNWNVDDFVFEELYADWVIDGAIAGKVGADIATQGGAGFYFPVGSITDSHEPYGSADVYLEPRYPMYTGDTHHSQISAIYGRRRIGLTGSVNISVEPGFQLGFTTVDDMTSDSDIIDFSV